ncbi:MAG: hypothetical protein MJB57_13810 [Gemmatimonadetes bacterium]|nr:hypothetical protein [Gemmatimonadota bacterium]
MSYPSRPARSRTARLGGLAAFLALVGTSPLTAQTVDRFGSTADAYDRAAVSAYISELRAQLADRHGALARTMFDLHEGLMITPHELVARPRPPFIDRIRYRVEPAHLVHYQAENGGSLGTLHGSTDHPLDVDWFPHSMFAQDGRVFGLWGHARLLGAVASHVTRHSE